MAQFSNRKLHYRLPLRALCTLALVVLLGIGNTARAVDASRSISQYSHTAWRLQDGELPAPAYPMAQTADGYLWIGTQAGLVRFDGVRFVALETLTQQRLQNPFILALRSGADGALWIGTPAGLSRWKDGQLTAYAGADDGVLSIAEDQQGKIWFLTSDRDKKPLCEVAGTGATCHGPEDGLVVSGLCCDRMITDGRGTFWLSTDTAVVRWSAHTPSKAFPVEAKAKSGTPGVLVMSLDSSGALWGGLPMKGAGLGLQRLVDDQWQAFDAAGIKGGNLAVQALLRDRNGVLWIGTIDDGIYRLAAGRVDHFGRSDGLTSDSIYAFFEDHEGNLWVATSAGIDRFRDFKVWSYTTREGMSVDEVDSVAAARDGSIWVGTANSLDRVAQGQVQSLRAGKELPGTQVTSLLEDDLGRLWVGIDEGLWIHAKGKFTAVLDSHGQPLHGQVNDLAQEAGGDLWATVRAKPRKLIRIRGDTVVESFEVAGASVPLSMAADPRGGVWLGLRDGYLTHSHALDKRIATHLEGSIKSLAVLHDGIVVAGSSEGLGLFQQGGALRTLTAKDGLPCDAVNGIVEDKQGALWLYMGCGLARIEHAELEQSLRDTSHRISAQLLDVRDGVRPGAAPFQPAARAADDSLWFANGVGLQTLDPGAMKAGGQPLPIHIEGLLADRKAHPLSQGMALPALTRDVQVDYTAIDLAVPQRVHFRYRLDGHDREWIDAGTRRQAFYTDLAPGRYRFQVAATAGDAPFASPPASLDFTIQPAFYQTRWFLLLVVASVVAVLGLLFRWRLARVKGQMRALIEERLAERERIARELHDTFLQAVHGLMLRFQAAVERIPASEPARGLMEKALDHADQVIIEGRDRVAMLREQQDRPDFLVLLQQEGEELARDRRVAFKFAVEGTPRPLDPAAAEEIRRIAQEALANAFRHSQATQVSLRVTYAHTRLSLGIVDNGTGFDVHGIGKHGPEGHWGVRGMHERADQLRARLTLSSRIGAGTSLELGVPAAMAYQRSRMSWMRRVWGFFRTKRTLASSRPD